MSKDTEGKLELSTTQVAGSALAAMSGAFLTSWAGTAGTLIGAAVASVIATVGAATYTYSIRRSAAAVKRTAAQVRLSGLSTGVLPRTTIHDAVAEDATQRAATDGTTDDEVPAGDRPSFLQRWRLPWAKVALASVAVLALALGGLTAIETITGRSAASYMGNSDPSGSTLGNAVSNDSDRAEKDTDEQDTPRDEPTSEPTQDPTEEPTTEPSATPSESAAPTESATPTPTPTPTPSESATPDSGGEDLAP